MELFAFPFAGGNEHCYRELGQRLKRINLNVQPLPGRGSLMAQPCISGIDEMVDYLFQRIKDGLHRPYAFFGHSMGAFIAYMLCRKVSQENMPLPEKLILSGRRAPSIVEDEPKHKMSSLRFRQALRDLGGIPDAVWQDEEIMALFEPIIRADFELIETYSYQRQEALNIPVHLFLGRYDSVSYDQAEAWQKETLQPINITYFDGGHFYFKDDDLLLMQLAQKISDELMG
jgi:surfactin synthase thioesterase subunit